MYAAIEDNRKPVIAAVNGYALGGGMELVLCCDIVIASDIAKLGLPEIKLGLVPGGGGTQRSVAKLGRNRANMLLMTGAIVPAAEFVAAGLVNEVVEPEELMPRALGSRTAIADEPAEAIEGLKRLDRASRPGDLAAGLALERELVGGLYRSETGQRRVQAFAAKSAARGGKAEDRRERSDDYRGLGWEHGALAVQRLGAMLAPLTFVLADGRQVTPLQVAPWAGEPGAEDLPGILRRLRGEWPCVPFGYSVPGEGWPADWAALIAGRARRGGARPRLQPALELVLPDAGTASRSRSTIRRRARSRASSGPSRPTRPRLPSTSSSASRCAQPAACRSGCIRLSGCRPSRARRRIEPAPLRPWPHLSRHRRAWSRCLRPTAASHPSTRCRRATAARGCGRRALRRRHRGAAAARTASAARPRSRTMPRATGCG